MQFLEALLESNVTRSVLAALAICVSFIIYRLNQKRKSLSYRIATRTTLFDVDKEIGGRVQVLFDGQPAEKIGLVVIEVLNTGNEPIKREDFVRPLLFKFTPPSQVISAEVGATKPKNLGAALTASVASVTLEPLLMNSRDEVSIKILLKDFAGRVECDARIVGVGDIKRLHKSSSPVRPRIYALSFGMAFGGILLAIAPDDIMKFDPKLILIVFLFTVILALCLHFVIRKSARADDRDDPSN